MLESIEKALAITRDRNAPVEERTRAAEFLAQAGYEDAYRPPLDHFLECDAVTAWELTTGFPRQRLTREDKLRLAVLLREHPDEQRRAATSYFLQNVLTSPRVRRMLIESFEDPKETPYVRGVAAEALTYHAGLEAFCACIRQLSDPEPAVRFWAVFALGQMAQYKYWLRKNAISALERMIHDPGQHPEFWPVGYEARAMLEPFVPEQARKGDEERASVLADPNAPADLKRWAEFYS